MNFELIDWVIIIALLFVITAAAIYTRRYNRSVRDFLSASRSAGRYILCVGDGMAGLGAITLVANWEFFYNAGFPMVWWQQIFNVTILPTVFGLTGWIFYRFRETRSLTTAEFIERRYGSKRLRIFVGILFFVAGIVNFGIFPAAGARFFIYFIGIQDTTANYVIVMSILIVIAVFYTFVGGQIAVMVTDFVQGVFCNIAFIIVLVFLFGIVSWEQIYEVLSKAPENASMLHPFRVSSAKDFTPFFYVILIANACYLYGSWQGNQGYKSAARNPHEAKMGKTLLTWRTLISIIFMTMLPILAYTVMHHPDFAHRVSGISEQIGQISIEKSETIAKQVTTSIVMTRMLPFGLFGLMAAVMLAAFITTHDTYLHSWGSILVQDVIMPFRKTRFKPRTHILLLRLSIIFVAIFIFFFSLLFRQVEYIFMFFILTGGIVAGTGAVQIGGLYWKKGSTAGAWLAMITGALMSTTSIVLQQVHKSYPFENPVLAYISSRSGLILGFSAAVGSVLVYVIASLIVNKDHNMDKLLHRGKYRIEDDAVTLKKKSGNGFLSRIGITKEFSVLDKYIYLSVMVWVLVLIIMFLSVTVLNLIFDFTERWWFNFWKYFISIIFVLGAIFTIWLSIGGISDARKMLKRLNTMVKDDSDDGMVIDEDINRN